MKQYLKHVSLSLGSDDSLLLVISDPQTEDYFMQYPENRKQLEELLADYSGKEVKVDLKTVENKQEFEQNYVDLSKVIHMEIEEEEE